MISKIQEKKHEWGVCICTERCLICLYIHIFKCFNIRKVNIILTTMTNLVHLTTYQSISRSRTNLTVGTKKQIFQKSELVQIGKSKCTLTDGIGLKKPSLIILLTSPGHVRMNDLWGRSLNSHAHVCCVYNSMSLAIGMC